MDYHYRGVEKAEVRAEDRNVFQDGSLAVSRRENQLCDREEAAARMTSTAWWRSSASTCRMMRRRWFLTVNSDRFRLAAISLLVRPFSTRSTSCSCRWVREPLALPGWAALLGFSRYSWARCWIRAMQSFGGQAASPCATPRTAAMISDAEASFKMYPLTPQ